MCTLPVGGYLFPLGIPRVSILFELFNRNERNLFNLFLFKQTCRLCYFRDQAFVINFTDNNYLTLISWPHSVAKISNICLWQHYCSSQLNEPSICFNYLKTFCTFLWHVLKTTKFLIELIFCNHYNFMVRFNCFKCARWVADSLRAVFIFQLFLQTFTEFSIIWD